MTEIPLTAMAAMGRYRIGTPGQCSGGSDIPPSVVQPTHPRPHQAMGKIHRAGRHRLPARSSDPSCCSLVDLAGVAAVRRS